MISSSQSRLASVDFAALMQSLQPGLAALDLLLAEQVKSFEPEVREMAGYCLNSSGKRLRPLLVFLSGWPGSGAISPDLVRVAAVIEMVHLATLVHDDILDQAMLRRGRTTIAARDGQSIAVLLGDALFAQAVVLSTQFSSVEVARSVAEATRQVCTGEIVQTLGGRSAQPTPERYWRIIDLKTAELFRVSCFLGARVSGESMERALKIAEFGRRLGLAYQIYDDLTDFVGTSESAGKTLGTDLASGKATLPLLHFLETLVPSEAEVFLESLKRGDCPLSDALSRMRAAGVFVSAGDVCRKEMQAALQSLSTSGESPVVGQLAQLASYLEQQLDQLPLR